MQGPTAQPHLVQELHRGPQDLPPLVHLDAVELLLQSQHLRPLRRRLGELAVGVQDPSGVLASPLPRSQPPRDTHSLLGQGQTVPGLEGVGCPLQGPEAVEEEDVEGDEDDEAGSRGQRSGAGHNLKGHYSSPFQRRKLRLRDGETCPGSHSTKQRSQGSHPV